MTSREMFFKICELKGYVVETNAKRKYRIYDNLGVQKTSSEDTVSDAWDALWYANDFDWTVSVDRSLKLLDEISANVTIKRISDLWFIKAGKIEHEGNFLQEVICLLYISWKTAQSTPVCVASLSLS